MSLPVFNIERFAIHDGPGIRTCVFLQGCPLHCVWCANPESQTIAEKLMFMAGKCTGCGRCVSVCPVHAVSLQDGKAVTDRTVCMNCGRCTQACQNDARTISGKAMDLKEIHDEIIKDKAYYTETSGGATFSGGEPVSLGRELLPLLKQLHEESISIAFETCGHAALSQYQATAPYVDHWLFDIKSLDPVVLKRYTGADLSVILTNLSFLAESHPERITIRVPVIPTVNNTREDMERLAALMHELALTKADLLPYHTLGMSKYRQLGRPYPFEIVKAMRTEQLLPLASCLHEQGIQVRIGG